MPSCRTRHFVWISLAWLAFWLAFFKGSGLADSGYHFVDYHDVIRIHDELISGQRGIADVAAELGRFDAEARRFRPLYYPSRILRTLAFGLDWRPWYFYNAFLAAFTSIGLSSFGLLAGFTLPAAIGLAAFATLGPPSIAWWRLGVSEAESAGLIALALLLFAAAVRQPRHRRLFDALGLLAAILASLTKESMILFLPAVCLIRVWLAWRLRGDSLSAAIYQARSVIALLLAVGLLEITWLLSSVGTQGTGYAGVDTASWQWRGLIDNAAGVFKVGVLAIPLTALMLAVRPSNVNGQPAGAAAWQNIAFLAVIFIVGAGPQLILYAKSGLTSHYYQPLVIVAALFAVGSIEALRGQHIGSYQLLLLATFAVILAKGRWTWFHGTDFTHEGLATQRVFAAVADCVSERRTVLIAGNPRVDYEVAQSLRTYLASQLQLPDTRLVTFGSEGAAFTSSALADRERPLAWMNTDRLGRGVFGGQTLDRLDEQTLEPVQAVVILSAEALRNDVVQALPVAYRHTTTRIVLPRVMDIDVLCRR